MKNESFEKIKFRNVSFSNILFNKNPVYVIIYEILLI